MVGDSLLVHPYFYELDFFSSESLLCYLLRRLFHVNQILTFTNGIFYDSISKLKRVVLELLLTVPHETRNGRRRPKREELA